MNILLNTLLQILYANGHEDLIALAVKIDSGIEQELPETVVVRLYKEDLAANTSFEKENYGYVSCPVITINKYKTRDNVLVMLPNGKAKEVTPESKSQRLSVIVDVQQ